jgi:hypothetical protein
MEAPRRERSIELLDRAGLLRRYFVALIPESRSASPRTLPVGFSQKTPSARDERHALKSIDEPQLVSVMPPGW